MLAGSSQVVGLRGALTDDEVAEWLPCGAVYPGAAGRLELGRGRRNGGAVRQA